MAEYIEREAVLEKLCSDCVDGCTRHCAEYTMLKYFPATDVRPVVRGKWIVRDNPRTGWYRVNCSECGEDVTSVIPVIGFFPNAKPSWDFCPNCGADMREES